MERPVFKPLGSSLYDLDTPSLFVIRDRILTNTQAYSSQVRQTGKRLTPNASIHRTPSLCRLLNQDEVYVNTVSEALEFSNVISGRITIGRAFQPSQLATILAISRIVPIRIVASSKEQISEMATLVRGKTENVSFVLRVSGLPEQRGTPVKELNGTQEFISGYLISDIGVDDPIIFLSDICPQVSSSGLPVIVESTEYLKPDALDVDFDELVEGLHPFKGGPDFSVGVIAAVVSTPESGKAFLDCGQKAISTDGGVPTVADSKSLAIERMSAEHGYLVWKPGEASIGLGDTFILEPASISDTFNLYDYLNIVEDEILVGLLDIQCRGSYS